MQVPLKYQSYVARGHSLLWNVPSQPVVGSRVSNTFSPQRLYTAK